MARLFNLSEDSIDSSALSVNPEYRWDSDSRKQVFVGYRVNRNLEFTANDVSEIGAILTSLTESGATQVNALNSRIPDQRMLNSKRCEVP